MFYVSIRKHSLFKHLYATDVQLVFHQLHGEYLRSGLVLELRSVLGSVLIRSSHAASPGPPPRLPPFPF